MRPLVPLALASLALTLTACGGSNSPARPEEPPLTVAVQPSLVRVGQELSFHLALSGTTGTWNLALFVEDPEGHIDQLLPNRTQSGSGSIQGGTTAVFPEKDANLFLMAASPAGVHTVLAYASPKPLYLSSISTYRDGDVFATVNANRQGKGSLDGSLLAVLGLTNPGVYALSTLTVAP